MDWSWLHEIIKKIELQSILVLLITLIAGFMAIQNIDGILGEILGSILIGFGAIFCLISFLTNNARESSKELVDHYKSIISEYKSLNQELARRYKTIGDYQDKHTTSVPEPTVYESQGIRFQAPESGSITNSQ